MSRNTTETTALAEKGLARKISTEEWTKSSETSLTSGRNDKSSRNKNGLQTTNGGSRQNGSLTLETEHQTASFARTDRESSTHYGTASNSITAKHNSWNRNSGVFDSPAAIMDPSRHLNHGKPSNSCIYQEELKGIDKSARRKLITATCLCLVFMTGEIVGGFLAGSLAIISDGVHLLTDFASFLIAIAAIHLAHRPPSNTLNFGWHRIEILGAFMSILLLWILTGVMCYSAVLRIESGEYEIESEIMLVTAATGVFFNVVLATVLNEDLDKILDSEEEGEDAESGKSRKTETSPLLYQQEGVDGGGTNVGGEVKKRMKKGNINLKAAFIHVLGDLCQSIGVLVAAYIIYFKPEWKIADPICTFTFSFFVMFTTITIMRDIIVVLMEAAPRDFDTSELRTTLLNVPGVISVHNLRVWSVTLDKHAIAAHLCVVPDVDPWNILDDAYVVAKETFGAYDACIQLECPGRKKAELNTVA